MVRGKNEYLKKSVRTGNGTNLFSLEALVCRDETERWSREKAERLFNANRIANRIVNIWNSLPRYVVSAETVNCFKTRLDRFWHLFSFYVYVYTDYNGRIPMQIAYSNLCLFCKRLQAADNRMHSCG